MSIMCPYFQREFFVSIVRKGPLSADCHGGGGGISVGVSEGGCVGDVLVSAPGDPGPEPLPQVLAVAGELVLTGWMARG